MPQANQQIKEQLTKYLNDFQEEEIAFQKVVIIKDYLDYIDNLPNIGVIFEDSKMKIMGMLLGGIEARDKLTGKKKTVESKIPIIKLDKDTPAKSILSNIGFVKDLDLGAKENLLKKEEFTKIHYSTLSMIARPLELYKFVEEESRKKLEDSIEMNFKNPLLITTTTATITALNTALLEILSKSALLKPTNPNPETHQTDGTKKIIYTYNENTKKGILNITNQCSVTFEGERALILAYYYKINDLSLSQNDNKEGIYKTYEDFNNHNNTKI